MQQSVSNEQIDYVFKQLKVTGWPHAAVVTLATVALWKNHPGNGIWIWFFVLQTSHVLRILILDPLWQKIKQAQENYRHVSLFLALGMLSTGCTWAVIPVFYLDNPQSETFIFTSIALAGMICATLPALAAYLPAYLSFVAPIFAALMFRYFQLGMSATALLTLCFLAAIVGISFIINRIITHSITIDFRNQTLLLEVTEAKEKAEHANQAKSRFMAAASHDLRQPLQALGLLLESMRLRVGNHDKMLKPLVTQCIDAHGALSALLNALLELSRLESHELEIHTIAIPIKDMANAIVNEFQPEAKQKGLILDCKGEDYFVRTDPVLFGRVLRNLLSNAIKFTPAGKVTVRFNRLENDIVLSVIDTGIGIPTAEQDKIFDEYYQVSNEARNRNEGIGLGLSVVKKMCEILGHPIHLYSNPGQGTTFSIKLPMEKNAPKTMLEESQFSPLEDINILIIDDDPSQLKALTALLEDWKCRSLCADNIESALYKMQSQGFNAEIILSDYRLGAGVNGIDAINAIRAAASRPIPAILMSGDTDPELVKKIREQKFYLLHKPVKPLQLRRSMSKLLEATKPT